MLLALMYHRVGTGKYSNPLKTLLSHFEYLRSLPLKLPGDTLPKGKLSICVTFDDATFDFYHYVYPLLKRFQMRALVGVPVRYILERTTLSPEERLNVPYTLAMQDGFFDKCAPFCTWEELREMASSGHVQVASHSYTHSNLTFSFVDLQKEIVESKQIIENQLCQPVSSFIYPFGKVNARLHEFTAQHYPYAFRIGGALNWGWHSKHPLSRITADNSACDTLFSWRRQGHYFCKSLLNQVFQGR